MDYVKACHLPPPSSRDETFDKMNDHEVLDSNVAPDYQKRKEMGLELAEEKISKQALLEALFDT